jgi:hypothetical protein
VTSGLGDRGPRGHERWCGGHRGAHRVGILARRARLGRARQHGSPGYGGRRRGIGVAGLTRRRRRTRRERRCRRRRGRGGRRRSRGARRGRCGNGARPFDGWGCRRRGRARPRFRRRAGCVARRRGAAVLCVSRVLRPFRPPRARCRHRCGRCRRLPPRRRGAACRRRGRDRVALSGRWGGRDVPRRDGGRVGEHVRRCAVVRVVAPVWLRGRRERRGERRGGRRDRAGGGRRRGPFAALRHGRQPRRTACEVGEEGAHGLARSSR